MKKHLIIGTGSIGRHLASKLNVAGNEVYTIGKHAPSCSTIMHRTCDVTNWNDMQHNLNDLPKGFSSMTFACGNFDMTPLAKLEPSQFEDTMRIHVGAAIESVRHFRKKLDKKDSSILLFSSVAAKRGMSNHIPVACAKGAIEGLTRSLAIDLAPIRVNCISPSLIHGNNTEHFCKDPIGSQIAKLHPMRRLGRVDDVSDMAIPLLTTSWTTGAIIDIGGGRHI